MADDKKNGRVSLAAVLTVLGIIGGPLAVWGDSQLERGTTKEKITQIEKRQEEDRREQRETVQEVKRDVKEIGSNVQIILRKLDAMDAVQQRQRRER